MKIGRHHIPGVDGLTDAMEIVMTGIKIYAEEIAAVEFGFDCILTRIGAWGGGVAEAGVTCR